MSKWLDNKGPVVADTVYCESELVAKDVTFTLPGLEFMTTDIQAMGNMTVPLYGLLENMELTINKIGIDKGLGKMNALKPLNLEFRWVQDVVTSDGTVKPEGCKAFIKCIPTKTPETQIETGSATEAESTYTVTRQQIYVGGEEYMCVDRLSQILRINGIDYMEDITPLL
ncbi:MAG: phage major tail tube protein [Lachnospiraceae bacterium]|nr:phage major tail tube protein [Lachnospiraceae bacterium]